MQRIYFTLLIVLGIIIIGFGIDATNIFGTKWHEPIIIMTAMFAGFCLGVGMTNMPVKKMFEKGSGVVEQ